MHSHDFGFQTDVSKYAGKNIKKSSITVWTSAGPPMNASNIEVYKTHKKHQNPPFHNILSRKSKASFIVAWGILVLESSL